MPFINIRLLLSVTAATAAAAPPLGTSVTHSILLLFNHQAQPLASLPPHVLSSRLHPSTNVVEDANQAPAVTNQRTHSHLLSSGSARKHFSMLHHLCRAHMYDFSVICCWLLAWSMWNMIATCTHTHSIPVLMSHSYIIVIFYACAKQSGFSGSKCWLIKKTIVILQACLHCI